MKEMRKIGFPISKKENEFRRALIPADLKVVKNCGQLYFEKGYGEQIAIVIVIMKDMVVIWFLMRRV